LQRIASCKTSSPFWASTSSAKTTAHRCTAPRRIERFLSQPFLVAEVFTGKAGKITPLAETIQSFEENLRRQMGTASRNRRSCTSAESKKPPNKRKKCRKLIFVTFIAKQLGHLLALFRDTKLVTI